MDIISKNELLSNLDRLHTTELGIMRIKRNLSLEVDDVIIWCRKQIQDPSAIVVRKGKNWYVDIKDYRITVNAYSYTIITAHIIKKSTHQVNQI